MQAPAEWTTPLTPGPTLIPTITIPRPKNFPKAISGLAAAATGNPLVVPWLEVTLLEASSNVPVTWKVCLTLLHIS